MKASVNGQTVKVSVFSGLTESDLRAEYVTGCVTAETRDTETGVVTIRQEVRGPHGWEAQIVKIGPVNAF